TTIKDWRKQDGQHIKRGKATSNICTNESLCVLAAAVYMALMGKKGLYEVARQSTVKSHYLFEKIKQLKGFSPANQAPFFKEFAVKTPRPPQPLIEKMQERGYFAGVDISPYGYHDHLLIAVTEKRTKDEIDSFIKELQAI
ncbi:MAG: glycine dehydrogenase, partial [Candidatus Cloacimonadia bacterium]